MTRGARSLLRIIDANANRALEGARMCEEIARFHLESASLYRRLRALRHQIAAAVRALPLAPITLVSARRSAKDVGRRAAAEPEGSLERLLLINFQRVKESLRALEECSRVLSSKNTPVFQRLRFRAYDDERAVLLRLASLRHS